MLKLIKKRIPKQLIICNVLDGCHIFGVYLLEIKI